ncbi:MAG: DinB family protein [Saprospiraceae bacterium]
MENLLTYYCNYNIWANKKMAVFFIDKEEKILSQFIENSFPSIKKTTLHILSAERSWLARMQQDDMNNRNIIDDHQSTNGVFKALLATSQEFHRFVENQTGHFFNQTLCFNSWDGTPWEMQPKIMVHHCMNHSTYHRGQLITMARQLGFKKEVPSTDLLYYWKENAEGKLSNI